MAELEAVIEKTLIDQLCCEESQWTYRPNIKNEDDLWKNFKYILEQNNKSSLNDKPLSESDIDASNLYQKSKKQNVMLDEHIAKVLELYKDRATELKETNKKIREGNEALLSMLSELIFDSDETRKAVEEFRKILEEN